MAMIILPLPTTGQSETDQTYEIICFCGKAFSTIRGYSSHKKIHGPSGTDRKDPPVGWQAAKTLKLSSEARVAANNAAIVRHQQQIALQSLPRQVLQPVLQGWQQPPLIPARMLGAPDLAATAIKVNVRPLPPGTVTSLTQTSRIPIVVVSVTPRNPGRITPEELSVAMLSDPQRRFQGLDCRKLLYFNSKDLTTLDNSDTLLFSDLCNKAVSFIVQSADPPTQQAQAQAASLRGGSNKGARQASGAAAAAAENDEIIFDKNKQEQAKSQILEYYPIMKHEGFATLLARWSAMAATKGSQGLHQVWPTKYLPESCFPALEKCLMGINKHSNKVCICRGGSV